MKLLPFSLSSILLLCSCASAPPVVPMCPQLPPLTLAPLAPISPDLMPNFLRGTLPAPSATSPNSATASPNTTPPSQP